MHEDTGRYYIERGDHYFMERVQLETAVREMLWAKTVGPKPFEDALQNLRAVVDALELFSDKREREQAQPPAPTKRHMLACGKFGPAFQARMEVVR